MDNYLNEGTDPFVLFDEWFKSAIEHNSFEPTAMTLASVDSQGMPSARMLLLKQYDRNGFCFFTNYESVKSGELLKSGKAALVFHWEKPTHRQVRIRGYVQKMTYEESDEYFQTRARGSQIGAWASPQSHEIQSRDELIEKASQLEEHYKDKKIPCPKFWGGFRLKPIGIEFWQSQEFRLHDRLKFERADVEGKWSVKRLAP